MSLPLQVPSLMSSSSKPGLSSSTGWICAMWIREVLTAAVSSSSVLTLLYWSISSSLRKRRGIHLRALVSRTERQKVSVTVGEGPFSRTQITPSSTISTHSSVTPRKEKKRGSSLRGRFSAGAGVCVSMVCSPTVSVTGFMLSYHSGPCLSRNAGKTDDTGRKKPGPVLTSVRDRAKIFPVTRP